MQVGIVLAAGHSRRFGPEDKLLAVLDGLPLCTYARDTMLGLNLDARFAVVRTEPVADIFRTGGFEVLRLEGSSTLQSDSLRRGVQAALGCKATQVLITLADMPHVPAAHLRRLLGRGMTRPAATRADISGDAVAMPPASFPADCLSMLAALQGDRGAGAVIRHLPPEQLVPLAPGLLRDVDTPADLAGC